MFTIDDIRKDSRFYIDDKNLKRLFANGGGRKYEVIFVRLGLILRSLDGKVSTLYDTDVYPFLTGSDEGLKRYRYYCERYGIVDRDAQSYGQLKNKLMEEDYDIKKGAIVVDESNFILDGQHRACIMLYKYGPNHTVPVVKCFYERHYGKKKRLKLLYYKTRAHVRCLMEHIKFSCGKCFL